MIKYKLTRGNKCGKILKTKDKLGFIGKLVLFRDAQAAGLPLLKKRSKTTDGFERIFRKFSIIHKRIIGLELKFQSYKQA